MASAADEIIGPGGAIEDNVRAVIGSGDDMERMQSEDSHCGDITSPSTQVSPTAESRADREATRELSCGCPLPTVDKGTATHAARVQPHGNSALTRNDYVPESQDHVPARRARSRVLTLVSRLLCC